MQPDDLKAADRILQALLDLPAEQRAAFIDSSCSDDLAMKKLVERLLRRATADDAGLNAGAGLDFVGVETSDFAPPHPQCLRTGDMIGPYRLLRVLGQGGMATVFLGERADGQFEQTVAIKVLDRLGETVARFEQERQILASLDHPNVARLLDGGVTESGAPYVVMEYIEGMPLLTYCDQQQLSIEKRLRLFVQVANAVSSAHRKLIVHRDIKSENTLVTAAGSPKLLDFGIAKLLADDALPHGAPLTRMAAPMTPEFASPEQVRGEPMTVATDIYQLGYLLYLLLTGRPPYDVESRDMAALVSAITQTPPVLPSRRVTATQSSGTVSEGAANRSNSTTTKLSMLLRGDLDRIVVKALHKDPEQRYTSAAALAGDIESFLAHRPISARPDSARYRARKFLERHTLAVGASVLGLSAIIVGTTLFTFRLAEEKHKAESEAAKATEVVTFMRELFASANPRITAGEPPDVKDVLDSGLLRLKESLDTQPDVKADLLYNVGDAYKELGELATAEHLLQESLELRAATSGTDNEAYIVVLDDIADVVRAQGRYTESEDLARQAYESARELLGEDAPLTQKAMSTMGLSIFRQSRFQEAEQILRERLALAKRTLGPRDPAMVSALINVSNTLYMQARYAEALAMLDEAYALAKDVLGEKHPASMDALNNIALTTESLGNLRESTALYEQIIATRTEVLGEDHPRTLRSRQHLAGLLVTLGDFATATPLLEELAEVRSRILGPDHPDTFWTEQDLARSYAGVGRLRDATAMLQQVLDNRVELLGNDHRDTLMSRYYLGNVLRRTGDYVEAEHQLMTALVSAREAHGASDEFVRFDQLELGLVYLDKNEVERAAALLQQLAEQLPDIDAGHRLYGAIESAWGETLRRQGKLVEAEPILLDAFQVLSSIFEENDARVAAAATSLAEIYSARGQFAEAGRYRRLANLN